MNFENIINDLSQSDPEIYDRLSSRRQVMQRFSTIGKTLALAAIPAAFGSMLKKAYGQSTATIIDTLNFALLLEQLEATFYNRGVAASGLIPAGAATAALTNIRDHENQHVTFLTQAITSLGGTPRTAPAFDFSAGHSNNNSGPLGTTTFTSYPTFLAVAQTFEDTGVRAYKGQAGNLMSNNDVLQAALQIHSVEARHASHIRQMRRNLAAPNLVTGTLKPWITLNQSNIDTMIPALNAAIQLSYNGEENVSQGNPAVNITTNSNVSASIASEAFDEPLTRAQVETIVYPFLQP